MEYSSEDLKTLVYSPELIQRDVLKWLAEDDKVINTATSPFVMLLEAAVTTAHNAALEAKNGFRELYPSSATTADQLYHHMNDEVLANMFAVPAQVRIFFQVNVASLKTRGYVPPNADWREITIPADTSITVKDMTTLTLLNDIVVRLYDNGTTYVEQIANSNDIAVNNVSVLESRIISNSDSVSFILFDTVVKQVKIKTVTGNISKSTGFSKVVKLDGYYCYSDFTYKNAKNGLYQRLPIYLNEEYIDPRNPGVYMNIGDTTEVMYKVPDIYILEDKVSGNVNIKVYETQGNKFLALHLYQAKDYVIKLENTNKNESASKSKLVEIMAISDGSMVGGKNATSLEELRKAIIFNATGDIDLPVTEQQISRMGEMNGYVVNKVIDVLTNRLYTASKSLPNEAGNYIHAKPDMFFNTVQFVLNDYLDHPNVLIAENQFTIKSKSLFRVENSITTLIPSNELDYINSMSDKVKLAYLKENKIFYNPYFYVLEKNDQYSSCKVYDLDSPKMEAVKVDMQNENVSYRINMNLWKLVTYKYGYKIYITLKGNSDIEKIDKSNIKIQLVLPLSGDNAKVYFDSVYDVNSGYYVIDINTNFHITSNDHIPITNGYSSLATRLLPLKTNCFLYIYTNDPTVVDPSEFKVGDIYNKDKDKIVVFNQLSTFIEFGKELKYIWNKLFNSYTERKYKEYTMDVPLVYEQNVYKVFENGLIHDEHLNTEIIHHKGDPVLNAEGEPMYKYRKGDVILDDLGRPIIDLESGVIRFIDIGMIEYEFMLANSTSYVNYMALVMNVFNQYIVEDMQELNSKLLENTKILYRSFRSSVPLKILVDGVDTSIPNIISPKVILYIDNTMQVTSQEEDNYKDIISKILEDALNKDTIILSDIKNSIKLALGTIVHGVSILGITKENYEIVKINSPLNRFCLSKALAYNKNQELIVKYDVDLEISYT